MINELKKNIEIEIEILREMSNYSRAIEYAGEIEISLLRGAIKSLKQTLIMINDSIPVILQEKSLIPSIPKLPELPSKSRNLEKQKKLEKVEIGRLNSKINILINKKDKERFLRELKISEEFVKKIKKKRKEKDET